MAIAIADTSVLVALSGVNQIGLLSMIFETVSVPPSVLTEILDDGDGWTEARQVQEELRRCEWFVRCSPAQGSSELRLATGLGAGESECIRLALEVKDAIVLTDDLAARKAAQALNLKVLGSLGILAIAKQRGAITSVRPFVMTMRANGIRLGTQLIRKYLERLGETW